MTRTTKQKIHSFVTPFIPFSAKSNKVRKSWLDKNGHITNKTIANCFIQVGVTFAAVGIPLIYGLVGLNYGDINYKNWSGIEKERRIKEKQAVERQALSDFYKADSDTSGFLDPQEFYEFVKKK